MRRLNTYHILSDDDDKADHGVQSTTSWLSRHPKEAQRLGIEIVPHRTTLSRRFKRLSEIIQLFTCYVGWWAETLSPVFRSHIFVEDASLFKALRPVWHQSDR